MNQEILNRQATNKRYIGIIVEESFDDNRIVNGLDIRKLHITNQAEADKRWHLYEVHVTEYEIHELSKHIKDNWYMHFWKGRDIIAVFKGASFEFNYDDKATWDKVLDYGRSLGLPEEELNFPISGL